MSNKNLLYIASALIIVVFTTLSFILVENKNIIFWVSYSFFIIALGGVFGSSLFLQNVKFKKAFPSELSFVSISIIYLMIEVLIIAIFGFIIELEFKWYISLHILVLTIAAVVVVFMLIGKNKIVSLNEKTRENVIELKLMIADIEQIELKADKLSEDVKKDAVKIIANLSDKLRYSDPMINEGLKSLQYDIAFNITKLSKQVDEMIANRDKSLELIKEIAEKTEFLIAERNKKTKILK